MDAAFSEPIESLLIDGRISLAYEQLTKIPRPIADKFASSTHILDLSFNSIKDLSFLANFKCLGTLILDRNEQPYEYSLPYLPSLKILWLNNCNIYNMSKWITRIQACCPNLRHLSLIGNPGILSAFNGASVLEHYDYRMYVISVLPKLQYLDDSVITEGQRQLANSNKRAYAMSGGPLRFIEKFGSTMFLNMFKNDRENAKQAVGTGNETEAELATQPLTKNGNQ
ncbi:leucine-rich melanocyte differentiation-associated protein-like isoform X2 [Bradysia coprophila]|nr:leucine-rich melanocyte differentiation-associated protein-like isoform X2 [Bradysia coprophila]